MSIEAEVFEQAKKRARRNGFLFAFIIVILGLIILTVLNSFFDYEKKSPHIARIKIEGPIFDTGVIFLSIEEKTLIYAKAQFILDEEHRLRKKAEDDAEKKRIADEKKAIKKVIKERLKVNCELFFLKTPKINKNIIDNETNISGNTKLRFCILLTRYI